MTAGQAATRPPRPERGQELDLRVDALAYGGRGVARHEGFVLFVAGAIPGDRVRAVVTKRKRGYGEAQLTEVLESSPERIEPVADHPGVPWQVLPYERQLAVKREQVADALARIGHLEGFLLDDIVPAVAQWRYRNKLEYSFGTDEERGLVCGFHAPGSWERIEPLDDCLLVGERGNVAREQVLAWARQQGLSAHDRRTHEGLLRNLIVREGRRTGELQVRLVVTSSDPSELDADSLERAVDCDSLLLTRTDAVSESTDGEHELVGGAAKLHEELCGLRFAISPTAFFQTNTEMAERLYAVAGEHAALEGWERLFDLFCGIGTVGLSIGARAGELWGVEVVEEAVADAIENARANERTNARFFAGDVRLAMRELVERAGRPDVLIVDPPRAGLSQKIVRRIIEASPRRIVYISCNPTTLAPNAAQL
ncbi:MAG TPA: 23S rRNA (uracil(1939)-C(5))-methyltransferase RlmD, partial [Solirubrobacteraceae bacterium]|nr:23S rRNA (uracil(1939)-C(5))-methyltransferase RlmD [Solirubrobacteraceae bacterium]